MQERPSVTAIMDEIRQGLADTSLSDHSQAQSEKLASQRAILRQANEHASVLGRCNGSLSGRVCKWLKPLGKPVIEQVDLFHKSVIRLLEQLVADSTTNAETRIRLQELETRLQQIEEQTKRDT